MSNSRYLDLFPPCMPKTQKQHFTYENNENIEQQKNNVTWEVTSEGDGYWDFNF